MLLNINMLLLIKVSTTITVHSCIAVKIILELKMMQIIMHDL